MTGGAGDDIYVVDSGSDATIEDISGGDDLVQASVNHTLAANVEDLTLTGVGNISGTGNDLANAIAGNGGANLLSGLAGADSLSGNDGDDTIDGGDDADTLTGGIGADNLDGAAGVDSMSGGDGSDTYFVDDAADKIVETGLDIDEVKASITYSIAAFANVENLTLLGATNIDGTGNALANIIAGNTGDNKLLGGGANDTLQGDAGKDTLQGDAGDDFDGRRHRR